MAAASAPASASASAPSVPPTVLIDLEGTTTSISFVKDALFPYAADNAENFLRDRWDDGDVREAVDGLRKRAAVPVPDQEAPREEAIKAAADCLRRLISIDDKGTHTKEISGFIWKKGYEAGELKGHLYEDVRPAIEKWKDNGRKVYIYSSGSVQAQKLLMKYSTAGDMENLFDGFFDTNVGHKREATSYKNILEKINQTPENTLFLTDIVEEGNAAKEAGINVVLLAREGNAALTEEDRKKYHVINSFSELEMQPSLKRKPSIEEKELPIPKVAKIETASNEPDIIAPVEKMEVDDKNEQGEVHPCANEDAETTETDESEVCKTDKPCENPIIDDVSPQMETDTKAAMPEKTEDAIIANEEKTEGTGVLTESDVTIENVNSSTETEDKRMPDIIETDELPDELLENPKSDTDVIITDVTDVVDNTAKTNSNECLPGMIETPKSDEIQGDVSADAPVENNGIDDEKLNELLGEKGVALEKECDEILSKVEQVTNIDLMNPTKILLNKSKDKIGTLNDIEENIEEDPEILLNVDSNNEKTSVDDLISTVTTDTLDEILPELPSPEKSEANETTNGNAEVCELNGKSTCEMNGAKKETNGDAPHETNGKNETDTAKQDFNGVTAENKATVASLEILNTNGTKMEVISESNGEQTEIKMKKVPTEEILPEPMPEQTVEA